MFTGRFLSYLAVTAVIRLNSLYLVEFRAVKSFLCPPALLMQACSHLWQRRGSYFFDFLSLLTPNNFRSTSPHIFPQLPQCHKSGQDFFTLHTSDVKIKAGHFLIFFSWWLTSKNPDNLKGGKLIEVLILLFNFMIQVMEWKILFIRLLKFYFLEWVETLSLSSGIASFQSPFSQSILQWYFFVHTCNSFIQNDSSVYNSFQSSTVQSPLSASPSIHHHCPNPSQHLKSPPMFLFIPIPCIYNINLIGVMIRNDFVITWSICTRSRNTLCLDPFFILPSFAWAEKNAYREIDGIEPTSLEGSARQATDLSIRLWPLGQFKHIFS